MKQATYSALIPTAMILALFFDANSARAQGNLEVVVADEVVPLALRIVDADCNARAKVSITPDRTTGRWL